MIRSLRSAMRNDTSGGGAVLAISSARFLTGTASDALLATVIAPAGWRVSLLSDFGGRVKLTDWQIQAAAVLNAVASGTVKLRAVSADEREAVEKTFDVAIEAGATPPGPVFQPLPSPVLMEGFDTTTGVTARNGSILTADASRKTQGAASLAVQEIGTSGGAYKAIGNHDMSQAGTVAFWTDVGMDPEYAAPGGAFATFSTNTSFPGANNLGESFGGGSGDQNFLGAGWVCQHVSENATVAAMNGALNVSLGSGSAPFANARRVDALVKNAAGRPTVILTFDDLLSTQYSRAFPIMAARGLKATCFVPTDLIGQRMTLSQLQEMKAGGWDMQADGHPADTVMTTLADVATAVSELNRGGDALIASGLNPNPIAFCYPEGRSGYHGSQVQKTNTTVTAGSNVVTMTNAAEILVGMRAVASGIVQAPATTVTAIDTSASPHRVTLSANATATATLTVTFTNLRVAKTGVGLTAGSNVVTMTDAASIVVGMRAAAYGIVQSPATTVTAIDTSASPHRVTLSANATVTATVAATFTDTSAAFHTGKLAAAIRAQNRWKVGRTTYQMTAHTRFGLGDRGLLFPGIGHTGNTTLDQFKAFDEEAILRGTTVMHYLHGVQPNGGGLSNDDALFATYCDWLKARQDAGALQVMTVAEWYARDGNATLPL